MEVSVKCGWDIDQGIRSGTKSQNNLSIGNRAESTRLIFKMNGVAMFHQHNNNWRAESCNSAAT